MSLLTDTQKYLLQDVFREECLPLFPNYFEKVFEKRTGENGHINMMSPSWDIFTVCMNKEKANDKGEIEPEMTCVLPCPRAYWDSWIAFYVLFGKDFPDPATVCRSILDYLENLKIDPSTFVNFEPYHMKYVIETAFGKTRIPNFFFADPVSCVFSLKSSPIIECSRGEMDPIQWAQSEKASVELKKLLDEIEKHFLEKYGKGRFDFLNGPSK